MSDMNEHKYELEDLPGMGDTTVKKLRDAGILSIKTLAIYPPNKLMDEAGIGEKTAQKLIKAAQDIEKEALGAKTARDLWESRKKMNRITTGSQNFDELISGRYDRDTVCGGFEPGSLTELFGEYRTGKTQLCHQLCVNVQLPYKDGGLEGNAYYIDTNNSFRPERIIQMTEHLDLDQDKMLDNIIVSRAYNSDHQIFLIKEASKVITEHNIKLLVLDNLIGFFKAEYYGRGTYDLIRSLLRGHLTDLLTLTNIFPELVVVYTNQVKIKPDVFYGNPTIHLGGNVVAHLSTTRIYLRKGKGEERIAKIVKSPYMPEGEAVFCITEGGITD